MTNNLGELNSTGAVYEQLEAIRGFANAIKFAYAHRSNDCLDIQMKVDLVIPNLVDEIDKRLRNITREMHEQYSRKHPLTIIET